MQRPVPLARSGFAQFERIATRWADNDVYGHVNNVVHYQWFDTVVNRWMLARELLDLRHGPVIGLVVETRCNYFAALAFPQLIDIGLAVTRIGSTSIVWQLGVFAADADSTAAVGHFVHVTVDAATHRPVPVPDRWREALAALAPPA
ncbi:MAG: acyl-CoA thioesterase [Burkholderiales bacterium]|nr:acyl-CoA thioesterase [Burkholderiales bacterium]